MESGIINIEELRKNHNDKKRLFLGFCICLIILGAVIFYNAYVVRNNYLKQKNTFVETTMQIVAFNKISDNKSSAICKYRYKEYEYAFTCYKIKSSDVNTKYKIGDAETIKVNPQNPEEIMTRIDIEFYSNIIFIIDTLLVIIGIIYSITCINKSTKFIKHMENEAKKYN